MGSAYADSIGDIVESTGVGGIVRNNETLSFNINGEPIVLTPDDALNTFFNSGLEILLLNNVLVQK